MKIDQLFSVEGKTVLVTGGSRGIGEMIATGFLTNGARVFISSRKADACNATAARLAETYGGECTSLPADLSTVEGAESLAATIGEHVDHLDVLVNNAGASWGASLGEFPEVGWDKVMDTNVKGVFFLTQALLPLLEAAATADDPSRVINIGSIDGLSTPTFESFSYGPSKAAVHHLTRQLAAQPPCSRPTSRTRSASAIWSSPSASQPLLVNRGDPRSPPTARPTSPSSPADRRRLGKAHRIGFGIMTRVTPRRPRRYLARFRCTSQQGRTRHRGGEGRGRVSS